MIACARKFHSFFFDVPLINYEFSWNEIVIFWAQIIILLFNLWYVRIVGDVTRIVSVTRPRCWRQPSLHSASCCPNIFIACVARAPPPITSTTLRKHFIWISRRICVCLKTMLKTCDYNKIYMLPKFANEWVLCVGSTGVRRSIRKSYQSDVRLAFPHHLFEPTGETDGWEIVFLLRWHKRITDLPNYRLPPRDTTRFVFGSHTASAKICLYLLLLLMRIFFLFGLSSFCFVLSACCFKIPKWNRFCYLPVSDARCLFGLLRFWLFCRLLLLINFGWLRATFACFCVHASTLIPMISIAITFTVSEPISSSS